MKPLSLFLLPIALVFAACMKDEASQDAVGTVDCGTAGARMQATIAGGEWCATASVTATASDGDVIITGVSLINGTLMLAIDSIAMGTQPITGGGNDMLYTNLDGSYTIAENGEGVLTITLLDTAAHKAQGTADIELRLNGDGLSKQVHASFDVIWSGD